MTLPSYVHFTGPLLRFLGEQSGPVRPRVVYEALADRLGLSEEARMARLPSGGQSVLQNRVGWAHDALKRSGLSSAPQRGMWLITDAGRALLARHGNQIPTEEMVRIGSEGRDLVLGESATKANDVWEVTSKKPLPIGEERSPREQIEEALSQIRASVARDILAQIAGQTTASEFEDLVLDVLHALGYGMSREALQRVGRSGDGGIDGIVPLDRLGLQKVYVQAKKWQGQVGSPEVQKFIGALQLQGADKGVLIAAGPISGPARDAAKQARGAVVLIDGDQLAQLMIDHGVGASSETLKIPKLDTDYFEGE